MTDQGEPWRGSGGPEEEELPQMDGSCDACEPDEAQQATQVCYTCSFAFCSTHAEKHAHSTRHPLTPYSQEVVQPQARSQQPARDRDTGEGAGEERVREIGHRAEQGVVENGACGGTGVQENKTCGGERVQGEGKVDDGDEEAKAAPEGGSKRDTVTVERLRCKEHGQEGTLYCKTNEKVICVVCAVQGEHREHEIITLREAYVWQKSRDGYDLLGCTQNMADHIKTKWTNPEMSTEQLEAYVNSQFDELHRLVRLEEKRTLHLVDLKEAFLTAAAAAEKIAEITVHTERLQEEMACITQQLGQLDQAEAQPGTGVAALAQGGPSPSPRPAQRDIEASPRLPEPRQDPQDPRDYGEGGSRSSMGHTP
ncbi:tripartite motif-containing protein 44-like isoform X1 [Coregonus clupeaformis]|uniref:tripartite motif-containing protein 44-like isoform X1 n=1 Tax=Coregonus clupeaformis TaxID=59861 RepID=UPI001E1C5F79|nr:tripartite motif-containing protein 44-like isoform X1 [Coregonus clupeaformis]XP_041745433.2 tripartite motif-containing protein 44-like isoform X1 [Coregonus clupeaformis]